MPDASDDIVKKPGQGGKGDVTPSASSAPSAPASSGSPPVAVEDMLRSINSILRGEKAAPAVGTGAEGQPLADVADADADADAAADAAAKAGGGEESPSATKVAATTVAQAQPERREASAERQGAPPQAATPQAATPQAAAPQAAAPSAAQGSEREAAALHEVMKSPKEEAAQNPLDEPLELVDMVDDDGKIVTLPLLARDGDPLAASPEGEAAAQAPPPADAPPPATAPPSSPAPSSAPAPPPSTPHEQPTPPLRTAADSTPDPAQGDSPSLSSQASVKLTLDAIGERVRSHLQDDAVSPGVSSQAKMKPSAPAPVAATPPKDADFQEAVANAVQAWMDTHLDDMVEKMIAKKLKTERREGRSER